MTIYLMLFVIDDTTRQLVPAINRCKKLYVLK